MEKQGSEAGGVIYTIGHSKHPLGLFIDMLAASEITLVLDVRTIPRSRRNPNTVRRTCR